MFLLRCLLVWVVASTVSIGASAWALAGIGPADRVDQVVANAAAVVLVGCAAWAWLACSAVVAQAVLTRRRALARRAPGRLPGVPTWAARAVLAACGVAAVTVAPAYAADSAPGPALRVAPQPATAPLDGLPFPDRAVGPARGGSLADRAPTAAPPPPERPAAPHVVVAPGDSLWLIASDRLPAGSSDADVAAQVRALVELNHEAIGPDPDLIHPGLRLRAPASPTAQEKP